VNAPGGALRRVLDDARELGFLGPEDPQHHIDHAAAFTEAAAGVFGPGGPSRFLDLGSGAGIPGLVLVQRWPEAHATLLDGMRRRCDFARLAAARLDVADRVEVCCDRAEVLARDPALRERFPLVVARSFAAPAVTAEIASGFVTVGGALIVSEPPGGAGDRWDADRLADLGFGSPATGRAAGYAVTVIGKAGATPDRYPRRTGVPAKRPLW
jgi:16S rRNA (guanine527-N7)-methyltransferase